MIKADPRPLTPPGSQEHENAEDSRPQLLAVYGPDGKAAGTITKERLLILYRSYEQILSNASHTSCDAFCKAEASMLSKYKDGRQTGEYHIKMQNYWTTPAHLMSAIRQGLHVTKERLACPLNFNTCMTRYFSPFPEAKAFGATCDAFSCKWMGAAHAHPEHTAKDMQMAVRWALASAEQAVEPSLTVFTLPFYESSNTSYQQFLGHPLVHKVAESPRGGIQLSLRQHEAMAKGVCRASKACYSLWLPIVLD